MYKNRLRDKKILYPKIIDFSLKIFLKLTNNDIIEDKIFDCIENPQNLLDLYCKTGTLTIKLAINYPLTKVIEMENNNNYLRYAKKQIRYSFLRNISFMNISNLEDYNDYFDCIIMYFALNDLAMHNIKELLNFLKKVLKNRKKLIIVDYNKIKCRFKNYIYKLYLLIFKRKRLEFIKYDLINTLFILGYQNITLNEFDGVKLISCYNAK